ncbi:hypothetical protein GCM10017687_62420 [Streptomyces echinatus]|uniref:Uncharacterized protein n=1 Tax=Streptomyces echinatus TaxID=67293 RepID=A0A7W9PUS9_9ACTN|nr:hypothetical protein [Streptomyces echinatus]
MYELKNVTKRYPRGNVETALVPLGIKVKERRELAANSPRTR